MPKKKIQYHWELDVYQFSVEAAMEIYKLSLSFPTAERDRLTAQIRKSSRSVSAQIAQGWRRRKYLAAFVDQINQAEAKAVQTQARLQDCVTQKYLKRETSTRLHDKYQHIRGKLINMGNNPQQWVLKRKKTQ